jgi:hypothetical protein
MLKKFLKLVVLIIAVGLGRFAYEKAIDLPIFVLEEIKIKTNGYFDPDSLVRISGLEKGKSIYRQDLKFAADMIARQNGVVSCAVDRGFISNVKVNINYAEPGLLINADRIYGLSKEGIVLPISQMTPDLPLVSGRRFKGASCYQRLKNPDIAYALDLYNSLNAHSPELCGLLSEINFGGKNLVMVYFSPDGTAAVLDKRYSEEDVYRLCALHKTGMLKGKRIFDLRFGDVVVESNIKRGTL